jgi:bidirectional [NiFe] hydrogenase diaphorase subunit
MADKKAHPSGDERYKNIDRTMKIRKYEKSALLEVLNTAQETFGYLTEELLLYISNAMKVPLSQVYGVATFYHMFTFEPLGEHNCVVCTGTACHVKGAQAIVDRLASDQNVAQGETTADGLFSLTTARCIGSCGLAPVMVVDGDIWAKETPDTAAERVSVILAQAKEQVAAEPEAG